MRIPKFKVGDIVNHPPDLYGNTESTVRTVSRYFYNDDDNLAYIEEHLSFNDNIRWEIDENTYDVPCLVIHPWLSNTWSDTEDKFVPKMTKIEVVKFFDYIYTVSNDKMNTMLPENKLKLL